MDGVIIVNKPQGVTSHDVVSKLRKILKTRQIGHAGTLDPMATGVLPILVGRATKISKYLMEHDKTYIVTLKLGIKTNTGDITGEIIQTESFHIDTQEVEKIIKTFIGKQKQIPPMYSAIKIKGKKLYEYARNNEVVEVPPRDIEIYNIDLISIKNDEIKFEVSCSKGTYVRVLCEDIATKLGTIGTMSALERTQVNNFLLEDANTIQDIESQKINWILIENIFKQNTQIQLTLEQKEKFLNGVLLETDLEDGLVSVYDENNKFFALGINLQHKLKRDVVFA